MTPSQTWPVLLKFGTYVLDVDGSAKGRMVGVILSFGDEMMFEAWRYTSRAPICLEGNPQSIDQALALFYRRQQIAQPAVGWLCQRVRLGRLQWMPSVQWWGSSRLRPCDCYADGCVEAHMFRWEGWQPGMRRVLV